MEEEIWKNIFKEYKKVKFFPFPNYLKILDELLSSTTCLFEEENGGYNTKFKDEELLTYFYDFPAQNMQKEACERKKHLVFEARGDNTMLLREKLNQFFQAGKSITHVIRTEEIYGGDTHYSVWREYQKADVYEVRKNG